MFDVNITQSSRFVSAGFLCTAAKLLADWIIVVIHRFSLRFPNKALYLMRSSDTVYVVGVINDLASKEKFKSVDKPIIFNFFPAACL